MAWLPISGIVPQATESGNQANGMVLKFYANGTLTPLAVATTSTGATTTTEFVLDTQGYTTLSTVKVIPHVDQIYKVALYLDQADANADDTGSAVFVIDGVNVGAFSADRPYTTLAAAIASLVGNIGDFLTTYEYNAGTGIGGGRYKIVGSNPGNNLINPAKTDGSGNYLQLIFDSEIGAAQSGALGGGNDDTLNLQDIGLLSQGLSSLTVTLLDQSLITSNVAFGGSITIMGGGATIQCSGGTFTAVSTPSASAPLTGDATQTSILIADASSVSVGDLASIRTTTLFPYDNRGTLVYGELQRVARVTGNTIYFDDIGFSSGLKFYTQYTTATSASVEFFELE